MGLFDKKSPAEKKLKEITGGFILSSSFLNTLNERGLSVEIGNKIQAEVKEDIKKGNIDEDGVELRINYLLNRYSDEEVTSSNISKEFNSVNISNMSNVSDKYYAANMTVHSKIKRLKFLNNQEYNLKQCPNCYTKILKEDDYCFNCGNHMSGTYSSNSLNKTGNVISEISLNDNQIDDISEGDVVHFVNGRLEKVEDVSDSDSLSKLEELYNKSVKTEETGKNEMSQLEELYTKKVSSDYSTNFKFAYVLYLNELSKHPTKKFGNQYMDIYKVSVTKLKKQALNDGFIQEGGPLAAARDSRVSDIKKILKKHELKVSGRKDELIERLGDNLTEEELKKAFPKKSLEVSEKGLEFINANKHIIYYDRNWDLKLNITPDGFDSIFDDEFKEEDMYDLIINFLKERELNLFNKKNWKDYGINLKIIIRIYLDKIKEKGHADEINLLDYYFKSFIFELNNYSPYIEKCEPEYAYLDYHEVKNLVELMHSLSLSLDVLKVKFKDAYDSLKVLNLIVSFDECFIFLLKVFNNENLDELLDEFHLKYNNNLN